MREIKFRAWDKKLQKMYATRYLQFAPDGNILAGLGHGDFEQGGMLAATDFDLMQFTGLADKAGKDIFEGDIIVVSAPIATLSEPAMGWVLWDGESATWRIQSSSWWCYLYQGELEIVGNIHENSDLIASKT